MRLKVFFFPVHLDWEMDTQQGQETDSHVD